MTSGRRQRRDGSPKRVQLTSGDHGGPKGKKSKGRPAKTISPGGQAARAAVLREVERFRESIRAAEQRRAAPRDPASAEQLPAGTDQQVTEQGDPVDAHAALRAHLTQCLQAAQEHNWGLLRDSARQLAQVAELFEADASSPPKGHAG
ncbi:hypothetical protein ABZZ74_51060 [Streptomyces sp. NPDC006476]|jgi:hypothetical protein|uniref:hypothetical protein n=1 Tax=Streptomyces sp. NPDC006476 TaxID=3157175 RepID=UPI0033B5A913